MVHTPGQKATVLYSLPVQFGIECYTRVDELITDEAHPLGSRRADVETVNSFVMPTADAV
jgi:hypothetical protein